MKDTFIFLRRSSEHFHHDHDVCDIKNDYYGNMKLRISSIFVIMVFSSLGVFFPLIVAKVKCLRISQLVCYFIKFFGMGIIIGTAFVHLLQPAFLELGSPCLSGIWKTYNFAPILAAVGMFSIFLLELFSLRHIYSESIMKSIDTASAAHTHISLSNDNEDSSGVHKYLSCNIRNGLEKQNLIKKYMVKKNIVTFFILELGIIFHSIVIGFTLAVTENKEFITLYIVISFHQMFEGLGLGARLFDITNYSNLTCNLFFAFVYSIVTSVSIAIGLSVRTIHNSKPSTIIVISGIFNSLSSGILLYTGLVELLAEDFIVNSEIRDGFAAMAIIGIWA
ncbi:hypothetical protein PORY_002434 [Pneumocystis oryctolagi]|uniref:Uncharacterized protein n=1 Tax=Pneumocystis oryctolagi TaxID=42067 RepID=A0ACB7CBF3_9ASCO|nr:hypothetical protein PORY_002434 [Pneumocystis oryctolagi]